MGKIYKSCEETLTLYGTSGKRKEFENLSIKKRDIKLYLPFFLLRLSKRRKKYFFDLLKRTAMTIR
jgi:hypothetical protein